MNRIFKYLNIPPFCQVGNTIFKKSFYDNADFSKADRTIFTEQIDKLIWGYCLKPDTINIKPYKDDVREYSEIEIIEVKLNTDGKTRRIAEIIMRTIPYPMLLVFTLDNKMQMCAAHQRSSLADQSRNTVEEMIFTDWIDTDNLNDKDEMFLKSLEFKNLSQNNYYRFYSDIVDRLIVCNASKLIDGYITGKDAEEVKRVYDEILKIDALVKSLKLRVKSDDQINRRVEMNIEIRELEEKRKGLMGRLG